MHHFVQHDTLLHARVQEYNKVAVGWPNEYNIIQHPKKKPPEKLYRTLKKSDHDQTSYNKIQHDTTRWPNECNISYNIKVV